MAEPIRFRVFFDGGDSVVVIAATPVEARARAKEQRPDQRPTKVKVVKEPRQ